MFDLVNLSKWISNERFGEALAASDGAIFEVKSRTGNGVSVTVESTSGSDSDTLFLSLVLREADVYGCLPAAWIAGTLRGCDVKLYNGGERVAYRSWYKLGDFNPHIIFTKKSFALLVLTLEELIPCGKNTP